ncbi:hypothetical protein CSUI_006042 [Cystoisospora suis]|uniref:Uncharacterized protein n=1 Tax=Cystoisospora suis TaxID=483139 RepID=A0A2C6KUY6_9APIC|nr:hypothetical protein CSUI_006042 [Cystoisospora suis]
MRTPPHTAVCAIAAPVSHRVCASVRSQKNRRPRLALFLSLSGSFQYA